MIIFALLPPTATTPTRLLSSYPAIESGADGSSVSSSCIIFLERLKIKAIRHFDVKGANGSKMKKHDIIHFRVIAFSWNFPVYGFHTCSPWGPKPPFQIATPSLLCKISWLLLSTGSGKQCQQNQLRIVYFAIQVRYRSFPPPGHINNQVKLHIKKKNNNVIKYEVNHCKLETLESWVTRH